MTTTNGRRKTQTLIRISIESRDKIKNLAEKLGYAQVTVLEYILKGKIKIDEL